MPLGSSGRWNVGAGAPAWAPPRAGCTVEAELRGLSEPPGFQLHSVRCKVAGVNGGLSVKCL